MPIAPGSPAVVAEPVVGVAEAVPRRALGDAVVERLLQAKRLLTVLDRRVVVPEVRVTPANRVQGPRTADLVTGGRVQVERLKGMVQRVGVLALAFEHVRQAQVRAPRRPDRRAGRTGVPAAEVPATRAEYRIDYVMQRVRGAPGVHEPVYYGPDPAAAYDAVLRLSEPQELLAAMDAARAEQARQRLRATLAAHDRGGGVYFDSRAWIITAHRH